MASSAQVYDDLRRDLADLLRSLSDEQLTSPVPATPDWTIRDIAAHLAGDASSVIAGDFPREFFEAFGDEDAVLSLNRWTSQHVASRAGRTLEEVLDEWEKSAQVLMSRMNGDNSHAALPPFADRILITDLGVHQQDIHGALGIERERDSAAIRIATAGYVAMIGFRLSGTGISPLLVAAGDSERATGEGEPGAKVRADRFEMFRALSGRRSPDQIRAYAWESDPEPYIPYFYPYGIRHQALVE